MSLVPLKIRRKFPLGVNIIKLSDYDPKSPIGRDPYEEQERVIALQKIQSLFTISCESNIEQVVAICHFGVDNSYNNPHKSAYICRVFMQQPLKSFTLLTRTVMPHIVRCVCNLYEVFGKDVAQHIGYVMLRHYQHR